MLATAFSLAALSIVVIPLGLHDLPSANMHHHEAQHLGWINSALHGKALMADAGFIYGPLREYLMTGYCLVAGTTLLQVRVVAVLLNLAGLGTLLAIGYALVHKNLWLHAWCAVLLIVYSPLWALLDYQHSISLGWADIARVAIAVLAICYAVRTSSAVDELGGRALARVARCGVLTGAAMLYSQEYGLCALGAVVVTLLALPLVDRRRPLRARLLASSATSVAYVAGFVAAFALFLAIYRLFGRAGLFLRTLSEAATLTASGAWGAIPFPVSASSFTSSAQLFAEQGSYGGGRAFEYVLAPAVFALTAVALLWRAVRGRWNERASVMMALALFGITTFRVSMHRADVLHLLSGTVPAVLLIAALAADVAAFAPRGRRAIPVGAAAVVAIACASFGLSFFGRLVDRVSAIAARREAPARGPAHVHPGIARAGDVYLPPDTERLVAFLRANTADGDPIFCRIGMMDGPEIYFLADRRNPTRYDMVVEAATYAMQQDMLRSLRSDPPRFVVSTRREAAGETVLGASSEVDAFLSTYTPVVSFGEIQVSQR